MSSFVCPRGTNNYHMQERGTNIFNTQEGRREGGQTILHQGGHTFYVGGNGGYDDVDEKMDLSEANILVSKVNKVSAGAGICRGP